MATKEDRSRARDGKLYLIDLVLDGTYSDTHPPGPKRVSISGVISDSEALIIRRLIASLRGEISVIRNPSEEAAVLTCLELLLTPVQRERLALALIRGTRSADPRQ
jgi:hypothetical protein